MKKTLLAIGMILFSLLFVAACTKVSTNSSSSIGGNANQTVNQTNQTQNQTVIITENNTVIQNGTSPNVTNVNVNNTTNINETENITNIVSNQSGNALTFRMDIQNFAFQNSSITIHPGDTIIWTNKDTVPHTVTSTDGTGELDSPQLSTNEDYSHIFNTVGTFFYHCSIHPSMTGTVTVQ